MEGQMDQGKIGKESFLPVSMEDCKARGWDSLDFVFVSGDAYVDHPSFGPALICRYLESRGYRVGIIPQPDYHSCRDFTRLGKPRLGFLISAGNVDSMVNHYSVFKRRRAKDYYSPGGKAGKRPDRACIVYTARAKEAYRDVPVILGGLEASLRRFCHYDYWEDRLRRSILLDSKADLLVYGMGEKAVLSVAEALEAGIPARQITWIQGTVCRKSQIDDPDTVILPSYSQVCQEKRAFAESFRIQYQNNDFPSGAPLAEQYDKHLYVVQNPPQPVMNRQELDDVYELPFTRQYHPMYEEQGGVPALQEVKFSITSSRGCFGGCAFCALTYHQGRIVQSRSIGSILKEARALTEFPDFKGYISDVGGPTANFRKPACKKQLEKGTCTHRDCLFPSPCPNLDTDQGEYTALLRAIREIPGVKKAFVRSGVRFDFAMADKNEAFLQELCRYHISGTLKVAPEHVSGRVLRRMHKPGRESFEAFVRRYEAINRQNQMKQYLIPYFISSHPGSQLEDAVELAVHLKKNGFVPDQVQDFYPTPGTLSTCMYYTGMDPLSGERVYVPKTLEEKRMQRALLHFNKPENDELVRRALLKAGRQDLIGNADGCLIPGKKPGERGRAKAAGKTDQGKKQAQGRKKKSGTQGKKPENTQMKSRSEKRPGKRRN